ncbi:site-specific DNA-methyltransferase [Frankia sp. AgB1.9]|uniref:TRM11 family SAM-dependent methyltransferase n=1 Tax=unclassified Frankia TaxID=2632575 RepID=UPI00193181B0|nr:MULTISPECIES: DNA methyltransferase [unclassified Frankia]MBL7486515.1 site-specific DNA-methyltransferase [Frankia sp. AgW1.1]MBL7554024.1 site-specific DNA-methyltransferase [Frankia sp. AgB1.9]MBL7618210.1 site-specific DNA-methyltransferase [Frankia sp. AgB1.8]
MPDPTDRRPATVWATGQVHPRQQRAGRYTSASMAHPGKMLPAVAAHAIAAFTQPGDLVCDPMCGIGTTLVEAVHLGRHALGVEYESRWAAVTAANLAHAQTHGATGKAVVLTGDARDLTALTQERTAPDGRPVAGNVTLVLTSPPYGNVTHGQIHADRDNGVSKRDYRYSQARSGNLANADLTDLLGAFQHILAATVGLLRPGGLVAITVRPIRDRGRLIDLPGAVTRHATAAGLTRADRAVALLAGLRDDQLIPRPSFFALHNARTAWARGTPQHVAAHEDLLIFRAAPSPANPTAAEDPPPEGTGGV